jgi:putative tricarboxylic transport membrane protein
MEEEEAAARGPSIRAVDIWVGAVLFVIGIVAVADNYRLGSGWAIEGPQAGYFPLRLGVLILVCSAAVIVKALRRARDPSIFVEWNKLIPVCQVLLPLVVYIFVMQFLGMYVASALFIGGFMRWLGKYSWLRCILVAVITSAVLFWMFEVQFQVPLPKGPLEHYFGY